MNIGCAICSELFVAASDVFATGCGHLFHYACLIQWIKRSKSCPQCRSKTTEKTIHHVYFNVVSSEPEEDTSVLRNKIDYLESQIHIKDTDIKNATEENHTLNSENEKLREAIATMELNISKLQFSISVFKMLIECLEEQIAYTADSKNAAKELRQQLDTMEREMHAASDKKRDLRARLRKCQQDLSAANLEKEKLNEEVNLKSVLNKQLEDDLQHLEHEKRSLQKKVYGFEKAWDSVLQRPLLERPIPEAVKRPKLTDPTEDDPFMSTMFGNLLSPESKPNCQSAAWSPYLNVKSCNVHLTPLKRSRSVNRNLISAVLNKPPCTLMASSVATNPEAAYDGLGGHCKIHAFPVPSPKFKPPQKKLKYSGTSKPKKKTHFFI